MTQRFSRRAMRTMSLAAALVAASASTLAAQQQQQQQPQPAQRRAAPGAPGAAPAAPAAPALTSTAPPGRQSWTSDRRDYHLGDIVTVLVDEYTLTSLDKTVNARDSRRRTLGFGLSTPSGGSALGINSNNNNQSENSGLDARTNRLTTEMSARVIAIQPGGIMQLKGTKVLNVEQSKVNLTLAGWVRVQDVSPQNVVQSFRMADADLDYQAEGPLGKAKGGIIGRLIGAFWP